MDLAYMLVKRILGKISAKTVLLSLVFIEAFDILWSVTFELPIGIFFYTFNIVSFVIFTVNYSAKMVTERKKYFQNILRIICCGIFISFYCLLYPYFTQSPTFNFGLILLSLPFLISFIIDVSKTEAFK